MLHSVGVAEAAVDGAGVVTVLWGAFLFALPHPAAASAAATSARQRRRNGSSGAGFEALCPGGVLAASAQDGSPRCSALGSLATVKLPGHRFRLDAATTGMGGFVLRGKDLTDDEAAVAARA